MTRKGKIIAVSSTKGGPGKTTITGNIGDALASLGYKVAFLDVDPNQNLTDWYYWPRPKKKKMDGAATGEKDGGAPIKENKAAANEVTTHFSGVTLESQIDAEQIVKDCRRLAKDHDFVIIDGAGVASQSLYVAAGVSALVIIPATPSADDFKEAIKTRKIVASAAEMISERLGKDIEITTRILINDTQADTHVDRHIANELKRRNIPVFNTTIGTRTIFKKARFRGTTPVRIEPSGPAAREIIDLTHEILALLGVERGALKIAS